MVITLATHVDGHTQPITIEGQEDQDPDEPPIPRPSPNLERIDKQQPPIDRQQLHDDSTATSSFVNVASKDGSRASTVSWDGDPDTAQAYSSEVIAAHLEVVPQ